MQAAKTKVQDMVSTVKEKVREHKIKSDEKAEKKAALTPQDEQMAHQICKARIAESKMQLHQEKAEHRAQASAHAAGATTDHY